MLRCEVDNYQLLVLHPEIEGFSCIVDVDYLCLEYLLLLSGYDVSAAAARATPHPGHDSRPHVTFSVSDRRKIGLAAKRER